MALRPRRTLLALLACAVAALGLAACGSSHKTVTEGDNTGAGGVNAAYLTLNNLQYQVQVSRELNPTDPEDASYLAGLPAGESLKPGEVWFAVFLLVQNKTHKSGVASNDFILTDTQGNSYRPVTLSPSNVFAYHPQQVSGNNQLPPLGSPAAGSPTQAGLILFRLPLAAYDNRPLVLRIGDPFGTDRHVSVTLDV